jgi:protein gp37
MGEKTGIEWTDHTFNPWWGCVKVSPACRHCYAETFAKRTGNAVWGIDAPRRFFGAKHWAEPRKWNEKAQRDGVRRRVFCASMADVFEDRADLIDARGDLFELIDETPWLDWLLLTKRPENIARLMPPYWGGRVWPNVWLGTTVENQQYADERLPHLVAKDAAVRFVSYEPALGPVDFTPWAFDLDWIIAGGESGGGHRTPDAEWFREVRDFCERARLWFFFKQWGGINPKANGAMLDGREWKQVPSGASGERATDEIVAVDPAVTTEKQKGPTRA